MISFSTVTIHRRLWVHAVSPFKLKPGNGYSPYLKEGVFNGFYIVFIYPFFKCF
jgi:hypothetical protein